MANVAEGFQVNQVDIDLGITAPANLLQVSYGNHQVNLGNEIAPKDAKSHPQVQWQADSDSYYSLVMSDPDAPSRTNPKAREWKHWIVINIKGSDLSLGDVVVPYNPPSPPSGTGLHRYVFLVYKQEGRLNTEIESDTKRGNFKVAKFASDNHLENPVAGNFFQAQNK